MADRDDEATPFDEDRWLDRDDGGPGKVVDRDGPTRGAPPRAGVRNDPETEDSAALVDRDDEDAGPASWPDPGPPASPAAADLSRGQAQGRDNHEDSSRWQTADDWDEPAPAWDSGDDWEEGGWESQLPAGSEPPASPPPPGAPPQPATGAPTGKAPEEFAPMARENDWEEAPRDGENAWDQPPDDDEEPFEPLPDDDEKPFNPPPGDDEDAFNRVVERELSEHPYLGDSDDDEWMLPPEGDESSTMDADPMDADPMDEPPVATATASTAAREEPAASRRRWPIASLAVGALALALLALGGAGVLRERSTLQEQVRDLQAQLARRPTAEEAQEDRTAARGLQARLQTLTADLASLEGEYALLEDELAQTREQLAERTAALESAREEAAAAKAAAKATAKAAANARSAQSATAGGGWFVNFGTYAQRSDASARASRLTVDKGEVVIQDARSGGRTLYRVRVVGLATRDAAEAVARDLEARFGLSKLWIGKTGD